MKLPVHICTKDNYPIVDRDFYCPHCGYKCKAYFIDVEPLEYIECWACRGVCTWVVLWEGPMI